MANPLPDHLPYTVQNNRPRRLVLVHGRYLAPLSKGGSSIMHLTQEQFEHETVQSLLRMGRLVCIRHPDFLPVPPPVEAEGPVPIQEPPVSFENYLNEMEGKQEARRLLETEPEVTTSDVEETTKGWTQNELEELGFRDLQALAKELNLPSGGTAAELIKRILASQEVKSGS